MSRMGWFFTGSGFALIGQLIVMNILRIPWTKAGLGFTGIYGYFVLMGFMLMAWFWEPRLTNWAVPDSKAEVSNRKPEGKE